MHIIIVGCGKVGSTLAEQLQEEDTDLTLIDTDADVINNLTEDIDAMGIVGNGASINTLMEAGVKTADIMIAVTASDELNLLCCLIAQKTGHCQTIARVRNPIYSKEIGFIQERLGLSMIINPELAADWGKVLVQGYKEGGILPKWPLASSYTGCMVGYPAVSVLADLVSKDLADGDLKTWAEAGARSSVYREDLAEKFKGTRELDLITLHPYFKEKYGFVPADSVPESVSWGLEMAYEDWCISQIAAKAGLDSLAQAYAAKGEYYKRYLDPETKMMRPIMSDGSFRTPFNPRYSAHMRSDYTEGNAFQWSFFAPHDMDNFIATIGGKTELETRLDTLFTTSSQVDGEHASGDITGLIGQYAHGNEPSHHMAYLYNWTDSPWKGQERLDYIMREFYTNKPDGIIGNEDCGQMSAWYVMSALGFYQVAPGIPVYTLGRPMVDRALIHVKGGIFEIVVKNNSPENKYIRTVTLNGKELETPFFSHAEMAKGGKLVFEMTNTHP